MPIIEVNHVTKEYRLGHMKSLSHILFFAFFGGLCGRQIFKSKPEL